jgi:two-component system response regulator PilR (NtrC family)
VAENKHTLVVDDEPDIRELLEITLGRMGIKTTSADSVKAAKALLDKHVYDLCLTDMQLPDGDGLDIIRHIATAQTDLPVAMITAFGSIDTAIEALKAGAFDYIQKPIELEQLRALVDTALKLPGTQAQRLSTTGQMIGESLVIDQLRAQINKLARSQAPIYISGESGSGKEIAARLIHQQGPRGSEPFVPVNCGAIPSELMESEFFGHVKGAFTGAVGEKDGLFKAATGGTLFLDEVADLPLSMQVKLLRAIQEKAIRPVGSQSEDVTDVRILCATHKNLAAEVAGGRFRQDLYYRLNVIELRVPPLREHTEDIAALSNHCLNRLSKSYGEPQPELSEAALNALREHPFPGNVRELENVLERAFTLCEGATIRPEDLQLEGGPLRISALPETSSRSSLQSQDHSVSERATETPLLSGDAELPDGQNLEDYLEDIEKRVITHTLEATRWNKTAAAKQLGITFRALRYKLQKLDLE